MIEDMTVIAAKAESVKGTPESLTGTDGAFNCYNSDIVPSIGMTERQKQGGADLHAAVPEGLTGTATFEVDLHGSGATGAVPLWASTLLPACGYINSGGTFTRTLTTATQAPVTIAKYIDGVKVILAGAMGSFQVRIRNGQISRVAFTFTGKYWSETDVAIITPTFPTIIPPRGYESFELGSGPYNASASEITLDSGGQVKLLEGANDTNDTGFRYGVVTAYRATASFDPDATLVATRDYHNQLLTSAEESGEIVCGDDALNTITAAWTKGQVMSHPWSNREKWKTRNINLSLNTGFTLAFA